MKNFSNFTELYHYFQKIFLYWGGELSIRWSTDYLGYRLKLCTVKKCVEWWYDGVNNDNVQIMAFFKLRDSLILELYFNQVWFNEYIVSGFLFTSICHRTLFSSFHSFFIIFLLSHIIIFLVHHIFLPIFFLLLLLLLILLFPLLLLSLLTILFSFLSCFD